jgi:type IV pilus assembly protein PilW
MKTSMQPRASGFSLVEIMVAMVIGLIGILVIFQVFSVSESYRRTATGGGDAQQAGAVALYVLEHEMRQAGWGFNSQNAIGCNVQAYDKNQGVLAAYTLVPVRITQGAATASDTIEVNYGNNNSTLAPTSLFQNMVVSTEPVIVSNRYGFTAGDLFLVAEPGKNCTLSQVTSLPAAPLTTTINRDAASGLSRYNNPAGSGVLYTVNGFLFNLGSAPSRNIYSVVNNSLVMVPFLNSSTAQGVAENIVQMKAQYGMDDGVGGTAGDGIVDEWINTPQPVTAAQWAQMLAVRIGIVARSATPEKANSGNVSDACNTTTTAPVWAGSASNPFDLSANATWQCYRYKTFQTTIPVRNMLWSQG